MYGSVLFTVVFTVVILHEGLCRPEYKDVTGKQPCDRPDPYCKGESFPKKIPLKNRLVTCDVVPDPKQKCCMPQAKHRVCYGIQVQGYRLNFDTASRMDNTDFSSLCKALVEKGGQEVDQYATAYTASGNATLRYNFHRFDLASPSGTFIKHLACSIKTED